MKYSTGSNIVLLFIGFIFIALWNTPASTSPPPRPLTATHVEANDMESPPDAPALQDGESAPPDNTDYETGVVLSVHKLSPQNVPGFSKPFGSLNEVQQAQVQVTSGPLAGQVVQVQNLLSGHPAYDVAIEPGARVLLSIEKTPGHPPDINIADRSRIPVLSLFTGLFILGLMLLGGKRGLKSLGLVALIGLFLGSFTMPLILQGYSPILIVLLIALAFMTLGSVFLLPPLQGKTPNPRALVVILGCSGGLLVTLGCMGLMTWLAPLQGFSNEALASLWQTSPQIDFQGLLIASALLANLGILFHVCQAVVQELPLHLPERFPDRFSLALGIGRDHLATLINGLVLLYIGLFFPLMFELMETPSIKFFNLESIASLLAMALATGLGLILTVPLLAWLIAWRIAPNGDGNALPGVE